MSANQWSKIEHLTRLMAEGLLRRGVPQESCACSAADDQAADEWIRRWNAQDPTLQMPTDPLLCRVLLARFRYATAFSAQCSIAAKPLPGDSVNLVVEMLLIDLWYEQFRTQWLSGERGVVPSEN